LDNLVVAIGSTTQSTLKYEELVSSLLSEEMRRKRMDIHNMDSLSVRGHPNIGIKTSLLGGDLNIKVDLNP
jgi:hypothetical protein